MGFWKTVGRLGGDAVGAFVGDPQLGDQAVGVYDAITGAGQPPPGQRAAIPQPGVAQQVGQTAGDIAAARAKARIDAATVQQKQDQLGLNRYADQLEGANTDLNQRKFALSAPGQEAHNSVQGDILANAQDASLSGLPSWISSQMPSISGGLRPSMLSANSRALGTDMSRQALANQMSGKDSTFAPLPQVPDLTPLPTASAYDTALQGVGTGASFLHAIDGVFPKQPGQNSAGNYDYAPGDTVTDGKPHAPDGPPELPLGSGESSVDLSGFDPSTIFGTGDSAGGTPDAPNFQDILDFFNNGQVGGEANA